jgi:hypothetical protein
MAVLSDADRATVHAEYMRDRSQVRDVFFGVTKADLRAAVNGLDDYLNTNASAINTAIPQPARANLTAPQKAVLLQFVVSRRYLAGT